MINKMNKKQESEANSCYIPSGFALNLKHYRLVKGYSSTKLAEMLGLDHTAIIKYEQGIREPKLCMIRTIAEVLGVSCDDLLDNGDEFYNYND